MAKSEKKEGLPEQGQNELIYFAGLEFCFDRHVISEFELSNNHLWGCVLCESPLPPLVSLRCTLDVDPLFQGDREQPVQWPVVIDDCKVLCGKAEVILKRTDYNRFHATIRVAKEAEALSDAIVGIASGLLPRYGGLVLHTASVEAWNQAILFLGPSGAGKSTACELMGEHLAFSIDRAALLPSGNGFCVWRWLGGDATKLRKAQSLKRVLPLGALFRVTQGTDHCQSKALRGASAYLALRQAVLSALVDGEPLYEQAIERVMEHHVVAELQTVLGQNCEAQVLRQVKNPSN